MGLTKGVHFSTQDSEVDEKVLERPDFIVNLPDGKVLIIDSKVSLTSYERCVNAKTEEEKSAHPKNTFKVCATTSGVFQKGLLCFIQ